MQSGEAEKHKIFAKWQNGIDFWNFMHTLAAYYPEKPTKKQQKQMNFFVATAGDYFLIEQKWIKRFHKNVKVLPPNVKSRDDFILWTCEQHNMVNESIGKQIFPCILPNLIKRWGPVTLPDNKSNVIL